MKKLFVIALAIVSMTVQAEVLTPTQKLVVGLQTANAVTAITIGPFALIGALLSGKTEQLCHFLEGNKKPSSYNPNSDGKDMCPNGVWLRTLPVVIDAIDRG